ncbi:hypothetical protein ACO0LB_04260 [Undibacterium sp. SXout7W]|uniref:hypothetical protein n=1 Tax=Undibacterium sp. SXout7W TaxID=3413049 RepID=UPI003BF42144
MSETVTSPLVLIATDVFGHTPAVAGLVRQLASPCLVVSPFEIDDGSMRSEQDAYQAFIAGGGVARFAEKVSQQLLEHQTTIRYAIGFSAGASALWLNSSNDLMAQLRCAMLFYGSRIRDYRQLQPTCPVRLVFPEKEAAFKPADLVAELKLAGHRAEIAKGTSHGFMNSYSRGSCVKTQTHYINELVAMLQHPTLRSAA